MTDTTEPEEPAPPRRPRPATVASRCLALYLLMDAPRSLTIFQRQLEEWRFDNRIDFLPPALPTLQMWAKKLKWKEVCSIYDAEIILRMQEAQAKSVAEGRFDHANALEDFAAKALTVAKDKVDEAEAPALVFSAVAALKQSAVMKGGVSDRTETVNAQADDARARELREFGRLLDVTPAPGVEPKAPKAITNGAHPPDADPAAVATKP